MKMLGWVIAGVLAAAPCAAQGLDLPAQTAPDRHLVPCGEQGEANRNCVQIRRAFLGQYARALSGDRAGQSTVAMFLSVGARVPGDSRSYVLPDPVEACAWRLVAAGARSDRNHAATVGAACDVLPEEKRTAARGRVARIEQAMAAHAADRAARAAAEQAEREAARPRPLTPDDEGGDADPAARWRRAAGSYLPDCPGRPDAQDDCRREQRAFLDAFGRAMEGDTQAQRHTAAALYAPGGWGKESRGFLRGSAAESCAWWQVVVRFARQLERDDLAHRRATCGRLWRDTEANARAKEIEQAIRAAGGASNGRPPGPLPAADPAIWDGSPRPLRGLPEYPPPFDCTGLTAPGQPSCAYGFAEAAGRLVARAYICGASRERLRPLADAVLAMIARMNRSRSETEEAQLAYVDARDVDLRRLRYDTPQDCDRMPGEVEGAEARLGLR